LVSDGIIVLYYRVTVKRFSVYETMFYIDASDGSIFPESVKAAGDGKSGLLKT
jgi:hypothetical protein